MIIYRLTNRFRRRLPSMASIDRRLTQLRWYRMLCGGTYVKLANVWRGAATMMVLGDGTRILRCEGRAGSFHETYAGIQQLEDHS